jgi:hypothetical protein
VLAKSSERDDRDTKLQARAGRGRRFAAASAPAAHGELYQPTDAVLDQLLTIAPGWDRHALVAQYREWSRGKGAPDNPHGAFIGWARRFTKGKAPS